MRRNEARTGNVHQDEGLGAWQNVSFDKRMTKTSFASLTVPAWFVRQHGDKFQEFVVVKSEVERRRWTVKVSVGYPHGRPQVAFHQGWKAFAVFNGLVKGDRMTFTLMAKSKFQVSIHRSNENSEARPRLQTLATSRKDDPQRRPKKKLRPHHFVDVIEKPELGRDECNGLAAKACEAVEAKTVVHSISNAVAAAAAAGSSLSSSSDTDSHFFEPLQATSPLPSFHS